MEQAQSSQAQEFLKSQGHDSFIANDGRSLKVLAQYKIGLTEWHTIPNTMAGASEWLDD